MQSSPHPYRMELIAAWTGLLDGRVTLEEARSFIDYRIAEYGPEELVHSGLLAMNETVRSRAGGRASLAHERDRFNGWLSEAERFDADPLSWNRAWALDYAARSLGAIGPRAARRMIDALGDKLTAEDVATLMRQYHLNGSRPSSGPQAEPNSQ